MVPIHNALRGVLEEVQAEKRSGFVVPDIAVEYTGSGAGKKRIIDRIQEQFTSAGVETYEPGTGENGKRAVVKVGFHSQRHSFASLARMANVPSVVVQSILGHSSPAMTAVYSHTDEIAASRAIAFLPTITGGW